jgi:hypothetical protein
VVITRRGKPVVELKVVAPKPSPPIGTHEWFFSRRLPNVGLTSVELLDLIYEHPDD